MSKPLRILMIEDAEEDAKLLLEHLEQVGYDPVYRRVSTPALMREALRTQRWDVILSDYALTQFSAVEALQLLQERRLDLPFLVVAGPIGEERAVSVLRAGAHDYILKSNLSRLAATIEREMQQAIVRRQGRRAERRLAAQHTVTRALADAHTLQEAGTSLLEAVGEANDWELGILWAMDELADELCCVQFWGAPGVDLSAFATQIRQTRFAPGFGLPGRVWVSSTPAWAPSSAVDDYISPALAGAVGLHGAFCFPIHTSREIRGAMEFFGREVRQPDEDLLNMMDAIGSQIGQFMQRQKATQALVRSEALLAGQRHILEMVATGEPLALVLEAVERFTEAHAGGCICQIQLGLEQPPLGHLPILSTKGTMLGSFALSCASEREEMQQDKLLQISTHLAALAIERQRVEEGRNQKLKSLIEQMADGVVATDEDGCILVINTAAERLLGITGPFEAVSPERAGLPPLLVEMIQRASELGRSEPERATFALENVEINACVSPVVTGLGRPYGAIALLQDITDEAKFRRLQEAFVANVSHELRGPLTSLSALVEAMCDGLIADDARPRYLKVLLSEIGRLRRLTSDLLELSRLDSGTLEVGNLPFDLRDLCRGLEEKWRHRCSATGLHLTVDCPSLVLSSDYDRVEQILTNFLENAVRFTERNGRIGLCASREEGYVRISVTDTGVGISPEHLSQVWDRFFKVDKARTRSPENGTGLGLAICRQLVGLLGGKTFAESVPSKGSTFGILLPLS